MKKLIFLLLMAVILVGFVSANAVHPPWAESPVMADTVLAEYGVRVDTVTQPAVLVLALSTTEQTSILTVAVHDYFPALSEKIMSIGLDTGQACISNKADYYLRL